MSDVVEHSLQNKTETINITTVNVDKMDFKNLLIASTTPERRLLDWSVTQERLKWRNVTRSLQTQRFSHELGNRRLEPEKQ
jgi:hypothetical protein